MKLIFERSKRGRGCSILPECDVPVVLPDGDRRERELHLPQVSETDVSRHYTKLAKQTYGVNDGFYPLGSCTMKYNPKVDEETAALPGFSEIHPLQPAHTVQGSLAVLAKAEELFCEVTGMDGMSFQPAAGAHGEFTGLLLIKAYHRSRGDQKRTKILVPDSAHGTNPASASMVGFTIINIPSAPDGGVDLKALQNAAGEDTAGLMLTNPNTVGLFDRNILEITKIVHESGGLCYYDGANLNAVMGVARPGDMGFDVIHLNLHKTFAAPHGGGGPGSGPCGCKDFLLPFLPGPRVKQAEDGYKMSRMETSVGDVKAFYGNFAVVVKSLTYILMLGRKGVAEAACNAVLNANYMMRKLEDLYEMAYPGICMHEFVMDLGKLKHETGVSALDVAKTLLDYGIHPPTMYFPLIVHEALMVEPTETESRETLDTVIAIFREVYRRAKEEGKTLHQSPVKAPIRRPDEVQAARKPVIRYEFTET